MSNPFPSVIASVPPFPADLLASDLSSFQAAGRIIFPPVEEPLVEISLEDGEEVTEAAPVVTVGRAPRPPRPPLVVDPSRLPVYWDIEWLSLFRYRLIAPVVAYRCAFPVGHLPGPLLEYIVTEYMPAWVQAIQASVSSDPLLVSWDVHKYMPSVDSMWSNAASYGLPTPTECSPASLWWMQGRPSNVQISA